ncbi:hypothetical protein QYE76_013475 [Lolium multiflorum]|uniref:CCHC-type domain-containing protein n=1 Tax=Lolium multiflorum TaxID=4521 RepID=A0AAD8U321_LOLMU|nr:hypothetical protein QYE76_013475 [Lolium multiflorum]
MATKAAMELASMEGKTASSLLPLGKGVAQNKFSARPVMEPSIFMDDDDEGGWTVVRRRQRPPVITEKVHDPKLENFSKNSEIAGLGLARLRASPTKNLVHWNPTLARNRFLQRIRSNRDYVPRQARVGASIAGHAFRKLLGFSWRKKEPGELVWRRRDSPSMMNGDGGRGGFNPGRGTFNAGRGGFQGRTGYQGHGYQGRGGFQGRGCFQGRGNSAPRGRQGAGRGGHHAFQGTAEHSGLGSGANFVQGESSGMGGMNNEQRHYQRNHGYTSGNNGGYGGHQQRWQDDRGYQYRPRDNGASMQSRVGIDADLLQQTVQAVVAAVTAATKVTKPTQSAPPTAALTGGTGQHAMKSVATSNAAQQAAHEIQDNQGTRAKARDNEGQGPQKKKEEKSGCFRCNQPGHHIDDCPTPFCNLCESVHHATHACHLHQAPKPTSILHGYANEALMFFELACGAFKAKVENPRLAKDNVYRVKLPKAFFKLFFEVEEDNGKTEVDMVEVNNGGDGNDDAHNGEHNKEGGNAMDVDPKGQDGTNTSNNGLSTSGLPQVVLGSAPHNGRDSARCQPGEQQLLSASVQVLLADGKRAGEPVLATCERAAHTAAKAGSTMVADAALDGAGREILAQRIRLHELAASGLPPLSATVAETARPGSSTPEHTTLNAHATSWPQRIRLMCAARDQGGRANHWPIDGQPLEAQTAAVSGSSTYDVPVAHGYSYDVIHMMAHWAQLWALLSPEGLQDAMVSGCTQLQTVTQDILCQDV